MVLQRRTGRQEGRHRRRTALGRVPRLPSPAATGVALRRPLRRPDTVPLQRGSPKSCAALKRVPGPKLATAARTRNSPPSQPPKSGFAAGHPAALRGSDHAVRGRRRGRGAQPGDMRRRATRPAARKHRTLRTAGADHSVASPVRRLNPKVLRSSALYVWKQKNTRFVGGEKFNFSVKGFTCEGKEVAVGMSGESGKRATQILFFFWYKI